MGQQTSFPEPMDYNDQATWKKVDALLDKMTLEEKLGQMNLYNGTWEFTGPVPDNSSAQETFNKIKTGQVGAMLNVLTAEGTRAAQKAAVENSRLHIPLMFGYDVVHGYKTMMPIPLAQAASWDPQVAFSASRHAAREAASSGINWAYAPMVDISRDARWGRMMEGAGEDPYLVSRMAEAWVYGFQGDDLADPLTIAACTKHFAGYGFAEGGRDYNTVDISMQTLYNVVLPPFKATVEAGAATFMNAFNEIGGVPATGNKLLLREILKGDWGFGGFVVSDWASMQELLIHGYASDEKEAAAIAAAAGSDMDMEGRVFEKGLKANLDDGTLQEDVIDDAVRRILYVKFKLGLFDDPYRYCSVDREKTNLLTEESLNAARDAARKSIVLLKNEGQILPLDKNIADAVVMGSLAESKDVPLGSWRAQAEPNSAVSLWEGVQEVLGERAGFTRGYTLTKGQRDFIHELTFVDGDHSGFEEAITKAKDARVVILAMGEDCFQTGEGRSQTDIGFKGDQLDLFNEVVKVNKNVVVVLMNGRAMAIPEVAEKAAAIVEVWHLGSEAGHAIADVLFGEYNPAGKLPVSFPRNVGQEPLYYNHKNTGRPTTHANDVGLVFWSHYTDASNDPLYPFGYGLSYTTFEISAPQLSSDKMDTTGMITVTVNVRNTGKTAGEEVVQLYLRDHVGSFTRPVKELKDFKKIRLQPGESRIVSFEITNKTLSYYRSDLTFGSEPGTFTVMTGSNSADVKKVDFELTN